MQNLVIFMIEKSSKEFCSFFFENWGSKFTKLSMNSFNLKIVMILAKFHFIFKEENMISLNWSPDNIIDNIRNNKKLSSQQVLTLIDTSMELFSREDNVLRLRSPITICGDIHGQLEDLFKLFEVAGGLGHENYIFMGDFVDRGMYSVDTICYLLALKLKYKNIFLLRGNHEARNVNGFYGFHEECLDYFDSSEEYEKFNNLFDLFPLCALIDNKVFCVHGGISKELRKIDDLIVIDRKKEIPNAGVITDMVWSDPYNGRGYGISTRGAGHQYGGNVVKEFCHSNGLDFIARSHQLVMNGYMWWFDDSLVNIWSAPNYGYISGNLASVMKYKGQKARNNPMKVFTEMPEERRRPIKSTNSYQQYFM